MYISSYPPETLLEENYFDINTNLSVFEKREFIGALNESIDVDEGFGNVLRPVFIVLTYMDSTFDKVVEKFVKGQKYWHAGISFGPSLKNIYSFNYGNAAVKNVNKFTGGISFESIDLYKNENSNGTFVYVVNTNNNNIVEAVPVSAQTRSSIAVVYDGLKGDETVISGGSLKVMPGIPVKIELQNLDLPEEFKQEYIEKYGQESPQDGVQQKQEQTGNNKQK